MGSSPLGGRVGGGLCIRCVLPPPSCLHQICASDTSTISAPRPSLFSRSIFIPLRPSLCPSMNRQISLSPPLSLPPSFSRHFSPSHHAESHHHVVQVWGAGADLQPIFAAIDQRVAVNLGKVLRAFAAQRIGPHHFQVGGRACLLKSYCPISKRKREKERDRDHYLGATCIYHTCIARMACCCCCCCCSPHPANRAV